MLGEEVRWTKVLEARDTFMKGYPQREESREGQGKTLLNHKLVQPGQRFYRLGKTLVKGYPQTAQKCLGGNCEGGAAAVM